MESISFSVVFGSVNKNPRTTDTKAAQIKGSEWFASWYKSAKITGINITMPIYLKFEPITVDKILYLII